MNYQISISKIKKIINPFNEGIDKKEIKTLLDNNDIFSLPTDSVETKLKKSIAYEVANYKEQEIVINLPTNMDLDNVEQLFPNGLTNLYAAIYLGKEHIVAQVSGNEKVAKSLLGIQLDKPDNIDLPSLLKPRVFQWHIDENMLKNTWGDKDFVLNQFEQLQGDYEKTGEMIALVSPELWNDIDFVNGLSDENPEVLSHFSFEQINTELMLQVIKNNHQGFIVLWNSLLENLFDKFYPMKGENNSHNPFGKRQEGEEVPLIVEQIKKIIFTDANLVANILNAQDYGHTEIYDRCPIEVQLDKHLVKTIYENRSIYIEPHTYLNEELKNNYNFLKDFITDNIQYLNFSRIEYNSNNKNGKEPLYESWIKDKEKVIDMLQTVKNKDFHYVFNALPKKLKKDEQLISLFMENNPDVYHLLNEEHEDKYLLKYIETASFIKNLSDELILKIKDKNILMELIKKGEFEWLAHPKCPAEYKKDWELLSLVPNYQPLLDDKKIVATLLENEDTAKLIENHPNLYSLLPIAKKHDVNIAKILLSKDKYVEPALFNNKVVCIFALQNDPKHIHKIPSGYWNEQEFVLEVFQNIDSKKISKKIIKAMPKEVSHLLTVFNVESEYSSFLSKYFLNMNLQQDVINKPASGKKIKI